MPKSLAEVMFENPDPLIVTIFFETLTEVNCELRLDFRLTTVDSDKPSFFPYKMQLCKINKQAKRIKHEKFFIETSKDNSNENCEFQ